MLEQIPGGKPVPLGADKGYDTRDFVAECGNLEVTPHVAQNTKRSMGIAIAERTTRQPGYEISQKKRKRIEECCGWLKDIARLRKVQIAEFTRWAGCLCLPQTQECLPKKVRLGLTCPLFGIMRVADFAGTSCFSAA